nr:phage minor head protein [Acetobacter fallax]
MLDDFRKAVGKALTDGTTLAEFRTDFDSIVTRRGWEFTGTAGWRADLIYSQNLSNAYSAGNYRQLTTPEALDIFPYWQYQHHVCQHPRHDHEAWGGMILRADDPWWNTHWPPNGWRCHCTVEPVSRADLRRNRWEVGEAPPLDLRSWKNPVSGKTEMIPKGIDPGFQTNPGKLWLEAEKTRAETALKPVQNIDGKLPSRVTPERRQEVQQEQIGRLVTMDMPAGTVEAGTAPEPVTEALKVKTDSVKLSDDTLQKNRVHHREITDEEYGALPKMIAHPEAIVADRKPTSVVMISRREKRLYRIAIKRTQDGHELFLASFNGLSVSDAQRLARNRTMLWGSVPDELESNADDE